MSEQGDRPDERLERALRRWGAEEAARQARPAGGEGVAPFAPRRAGRTAWAVLRWSALAAGVLLVVSAAVSFLQGIAQRAPRQGMEAPLRGGPPAEIQRLREELGAIQGRLAGAAAEAQAAREAQAAAEARLAGLSAERQAAADQAAAARKDLAAAQSALAAAQEQAAELKKGLTDKDAAVKAAQAQVEQARAEAAKQQASDRSALEDATKRLAAAQTELARAGAARDEAALAVRKVEGELAGLKARQAAVVGSFQQAYLHAAAGAADPALAERAAAAGEWPLGVRQAAARNAQMLQRLARLRPTVRGGPVGALLDRLEVVLTRLDLMDVFDAGQARSFAALLEGGRLVALIDEALYASGQEPELLAWLLEARLILAGADHVA